jgi:DNA gyrase subunit B
MKTQLLEKGLTDACLDRATGGWSTARNAAAVVHAGRRWKKRSGPGAARHQSEDARRIGSIRDGKAARVSRVLWPHEHWFTTREKLDEFLKAQEEATGKEAAVGDAPRRDRRRQRAPATPHLHITELHEVRTINAGLKDMAEMGFDIQALIPRSAPASKSPVTSCAAARTNPLEDLRGLLPAIRAAGEKGLQVTRFKGLGEMNAEELRETTLDPANRTLIQVSMRDAGAADDMFRVLMGDKVEPRREFIEKHALDVRNLDVCRVDVWFRNQTGFVKRFRQVKSTLNDLKYRSGDAVRVPARTQFAKCNKLLPG